MKCEARPGAVMFAHLPVYMLIPYVLHYPIYPAACDPAYPVVFFKRKQDGQDRKREDMNDQCE